MRFDGDIVITDPVYIATLSDWDKCREGNDMSWFNYGRYQTIEIFPCKIPDKEDFYHQV